MAASAGSTGRRFRRQQQGASRPAGAAAVAVSVVDMMAAVVAAAALCLVVFVFGGEPASAELKTGLLVLSPFDKHDHRGARIIPYWEKTGSTAIMQTFVRLTPDKADSTGTLWSRNTIGLSDLSLEWKFRISGTDNSKFGDTLVLMMAPVKYKAGQDGRFFGLSETFTGLAVVVNTNRMLLSKASPGEPVGRHRDVSIVVNNGTRSYEDLLAGAEGCTANVRFDEGRDDFNVMQATRIRLKVEGTTIALEVDARNSGRWRRCATLTHVDMPKDFLFKANIGVIAKTSANTNNHDMLGLRVYNHPIEAWEVDTYEDEDDLDALVHHMEHELFNVHDSLQETIDALVLAEEDAVTRLQELEESLNRNVMDAMETRVAKLEVQVQTSISKTLNRRVDEVYERLEEDVGGKLSERVGKMSASWRWPFYGLLVVVLGMLGVSFTKFKQLKKQHLL